MSDMVARGSKLQAHYHDKVVCPNCICIACNSMKFMRAAAVRTQGKKNQSMWFETFSEGWTASKLSDLQMEYLIK